MYSPVQVANAFVVQSLQHNKALTHMQVQKLAYIAHGYYLALTGRPLLNELVSAWKYGPVIPGMYDAFKNYGNKPITSLAMSPYGYAQLDPQAESVIGAVYKFYGDKDGIELSQLTHMPGTPWSQAYDGYRSTIISNEVIRDYYDNLLKNQQACSGL
ncbi:Panacea domain-containing protein [Klebsiella quasipneumoniae subsp. similipneumoniae]|uniref:Panacea domain-containing protein n=1 Tax=Klebsiella pneumoniae complex TaxID=3390273 RepID=UPI000D74EFF6|nr:type II toxin-antitoxin system antitoxin SocA domain-containing protein [Klebsiella variicola]PXK73391.1 hypothetical protein DMS07_21610 [Klebsiella variicola]HDU2394374.1 SocA family protein [Klebsiella pneumoniae]